MPKPAFFFQTAQGDLDVASTHDIKLLLDSGRIPPRAMLYRRDAEGVATIGDISVLGMGTLEKVLQPAPSLKPVALRPKPVAESASPGSLAQQLRALAAEVERHEAQVAQDPLAQIATMVRDIQKQVNTSYLDQMHLGVLTTELGNWSEKLADRLVRVERTLASLEAAISRTSSASHSASKED